MNEFAHFVALDAIGRIGPIEREADAAECAAIAARLGLETLEQFAMNAALEPSVEGVRLTGTVRAALVQRCAATALPLAATIAAPFDLRYVAALPMPDDAEAEIELDDAACDILPIEGGGIDVGEAAVQTLALALDPFPRHPDADRILTERGVISDAASGPFAALAALRRKT